MGGIVGWTLFKKKKNNKHSWDFIASGVTQTNCDSLVVKNKNNNTHNKPQKIPYFVYSTERPVQKLNILIFHMSHLLKCTA